MSSLTRPRGPLPPRVYWVRRGLVLLVAAAMVVVLARLVGGGSDGADASQGRAAAQTSQSSASGGPGTPARSPGATDSSASGASQSSSTDADGSAGASAEASPSTPLLPPDGPCEGEEVVVTPVVGKAHAGSKTRLAFDLRTRAAGACTWQVSPQTFTVEVTSGSDEVWVSRQCPRALPSREVVLRHSTRTRLRMTWNGRRSDPKCSNQTEWALPGWYHVRAAALGGEPSETQFELGGPVRPVVTRTATPNQKPSSRSPGTGVSRSPR